MHSAATMSPFLAPLWPALLDLACQDKRVHWLIFGGVVAAITGCGEGNDCGPGTSVRAGVCESVSTTLSCGDGTVVTNGQCVPASELIRCGPGTVNVNGQCMPANDAPCPAGTPGRVDADGQCVPANTLPCPAGTIEIDGRCVVDEVPEEVPTESMDTISCGPGTVLQEDTCVLEAPPVTCGEGTSLVEASCRSAADQWVFAPFPVGFAATVTQGAHGGFSHKAQAVHALDFGVPEGTVVTAARAGVVILARDDSNTGCPDVSCVDQANRILIDHGDATRAEYAHLQQGGALVEVGDVVCAGQEIGLSGNTGFSSGPHLHFQVSDLWAYSIPVRFQELEDTSGGVLAAGEVVTSENEPVACPDVAPSECPAEAFLPFGIRLDPGLPCGLAQRDTPYPIQGSVIGTNAAALLWFRPPARPEWTRQCAPVDDNGRFEHVITWDSATYSDSTLFMIMAAKDQDCTMHSASDSSPILGLSE